MENKQNKRDPRNVLIVVLIIVAVAAIALAVWALSTRSAAPSPAPRLTPKPTPTEEPLTNTIALPQFAWLNAEGGGNYTTHVTYTSVLAEGEITDTPNGTDRPDKAP